MDFGLLLVSLPVDSCVQDRPTVRRECRLIVVRVYSIGNVLEIAQVVQTFEDEQIS